MSQTLSQEDVQRLLSEPSVETRADLARKIAGQYDGGDLQPTERRLAEEIIRTMAHDAAERVRAAVADSLKACHHLSHDVAMRLAQDVETVAVPLLAVSDVFSDDDLIALVRAGSDQKQAAIAGRPAVSEAVSTVVAETGGETAVATLVGNSGAQISEAALNRVVDRFGDNEHVQAPLVQRSGLPLALAERLVSVVSDNLRDVLIERHGVGRDSSGPSGVATPLMETVVTRGREQATVALLGSDTNNRDVELVVRQMARNGRLTPSLLVRAICVGDLSLFEAGMAHRAGITVANAQRLIHDGGSRGLKSLYEQAEMPAALFAAVRIAIEVAHETDFDGEDRDRERYQERMIERILTQYEEFGQDDLEFLLDRLGDLLEKAA